MQPKSTQPILSVILPCYNEAEAISSVLNDWSNEIDKLKLQLDCSEIEIVVVDDGSTDGGCDNIEANYNVRLIRHSQNLGYGQSLKTGLQQAKGDWVAFHDCDATCKASSIFDLWAIKEQGDLIVGRRVEPGTQMPFLRQMGNGLYRSLYRMFFRQIPHDLCSGYRLFRRTWSPHFINELPDQLNFTLAMSLWMTLRGLKVVEAAITYDERLGQSKLSAWQDGWRFLFTLFKYRFFVRNRNF